MYAQVISMTLAMSDKIAVSTANKQLHPVELSDSYHCYTLFHCAISCVVKCVEHKWNVNSIYFNKQTQ